MKIPSQDCAGAHGGRALRSWYYRFLDWSVLAFLFGLLLAPSFSFGASQQVYWYIGSGSNMGLCWTGPSGTVATANTANKTVGGACLLFGSHSEATAYRRNNDTALYKCVTIPSEVTGGTSPNQVGREVYVRNGTPDGNGCGDFATQTNVAQVGFAQCPAHSTWNGSSCVCNGGYTESGGVCIVQTCTVGDTQQLTVFTGYDTNGDGVADSGAGNIWTTQRASGGCAYAPDINTPVSSCFAYSGAPTKLYCTITYKGTGQVASGQAGPDTPDPTNPCPSGMTLGTMNNIPMCLTSGGPTTLPPAPSTTGTTTNTVTNPDSSTTTTTTVTNNNSTTTTTTNCNADKTVCSTNTTTQQTGGAPGQAGDTDQAQFCRDNPTSPMCKATPQSAWSGACSTFTCDGDAVQCAIAQEIHKRNCTLFDTTTDLSTLGTQVATGADPLADTFPFHASQRTTENMTNMFDQTRHWSAQCPQDFQVTLSGAAVTVPLSSLCTPLQWMGVLCVAMTLVMGLRIALT